MKTVSVSIISVVFLFIHKTYMNTILYLLGIYDINHFNCGYISIYPFIHLYL